MLLFLINVICCLNAFWSSLFNSPASSVVLRAAVSGLLVTMDLPRIQHVAGICQVKELRNLDKSDMCEHDSASVCFFMFISASFNTFSSYSSSISLSIFFSPAQESLAGWTAAQKHLGTLCKPRFACSKNQAHMQLFLVDQFICVWHQRWAFNDSQTYDSCNTLITIRVYVWLK